MALLGLFQKPIESVEIHNDSEIQLLKKRI